MIRGDYKRTKLKAVEDTSGAKELSKEQHSADYRPIVGIPCRYNWTTCYYELRETYSEAVYEAGGTPLLLPLIPEPAFIDSVIEHLDAVCLSGAGNDVDPLRYGREPKPLLGPVVPRR